MGVPEENSKQVSFRWPKVKRRRSPEMEGSKPLTKMAANKKVPQNVYVKSKSYKRKGSTVEDLCENDDVKSDLTMRIEEVIANLAPQFPKMIKYMLPSQVTRGFWLGIDKDFCEGHLPKEDSKIVLEDENGECVETVYLSMKRALVGGWKKFAVVHKLSEGDVVVFHLVKPTKFKVYIVRAKDLKEDGALTLLEMRACSREMNTNHSEDDSQHLSFDITDGISMSESVNIDFEEVKSFEDFYIIVDGLVINSELSKRLQHKYYELCCSQKSFLHDNILKGLSCKLVVGIIGQTIRIADALRDPKLATFQDEFANWEKILKFLHGMGMNVGFLLNRLEQLMSNGHIFQAKEHKKVTLERASEEVRNLEAKLLEAKKTLNRLDAEIQTLGPSVEILELKDKVQEIVEAPWGL